MLRIRLFCAAGMSTSMLMEEVRRAAQRKGDEIDIQAYPLTSLRDRLKETDVALLGPQVSYDFDNAKALCDAAGKPIAIIPIQDYGMMNGAAVLRLAKKLYKEN